MPPVIDRNKCVGCGTCATICTMDVFSHPSGGAPNNGSPGDGPAGNGSGGDGSAPSVLYPEECWHCTACVQDCKRQAIRLRLPIPYRLLWK